MMLDSLRRYYADFSPRRSAYLIAAYNLLVVMLLFGLCRLIFYALNADLFARTTASGLLRLCCGGLRFDLAATIYLNMPYLLLMLLPFGFRYGRTYQQVASGMFLIFNSLGLLANCADCIYFRFTLRRTTASVFSEFGHEGNLGALLLQFLADYWYMVLIYAALVTVLVLLHRRPQRPTLYPDWPYRAVYVGHGLLLMLLSAALLVGGVRGGFRHSTRPITLSNANAYVNEPLEAAIVLNTPFAMLRTIGNSPLPELRYFASESELAQRFDPVQRVGHPERPMRRLNVVVFILESFGREYIAAYNSPPVSSGYRGYAPFMDSLMGRSLYFQHAYANGRKSIDAMPSVLAGIPMMVEPYFLTSYSANRINSLASALRGEGYATAFFHGAPNGSMGFDAFANVAGFERYYGMDEFADDSHFDGMWAIWDEEFFQYFAHELGQLPQPFCAAMFSASSHHPFRVPERYRDAFPAGTLPMHRCIGYTDHALRRFFATASRQPWFDSTLFVLTADHANQSQYAEYQTNAGVFAVPIIFHMPNGELLGRRDELAQQVDIRPSVLGLLNYSQPFVAFGRNLFDGQTQPLVLNYTNGIYQLFADSLLALSDGERLLSVFRFADDPLLEQNVRGKYPERERDMMTTMRAIMQQYNNRMRQNRLTAD
ncbi:MAG: LTA synthase family protein [Bacteroidales bacterium]|nr:LTA synthase family protein [Bacteroidales bacterium]